MCSLTFACRDQKWLVSMLLEWCLVGWDRIWDGSVVGLGRKEEWELQTDALLLGRLGTMALICASVNGMVSVAISVHASANNDCL